LIAYAARGAAALLVLTLVDSQPRLDTAARSTLVIGVAPVLERVAPAAERARPVAGKVAATAHAATRDAARTVRTKAGEAAAATQDVATRVVDQAVTAAGHVVDVAQQAVTAVQEHAALAMQAAWVPPRAEIAPDTTTAAVAQDTIPDRAPATDTLPARRAAQQSDTAARDLVGWPEADSVERALEARRGYVATRYQGERVTFHAPTRGLEILGGPAAVARGQAVLVGDTITYSDANQIVVVRGDTNILRDPTQHTADIVARGILTYDLGRGQGAITGISTAVASGEQWYVQGETGFFIRDTAGVRPATFYVREGYFTSCDEEIPDYHFRAREIKMITRNFIVARPATLYIGEVPVLWLPFVFQDIRSGRRSGFLSPRLGFSELVRNSPLYRRQVDNIGYYFALNDYLDTQLWMDWRSGARGTEFDPGWKRYNAEVRYRWLNRFMTGRLASSHTADQAGNTNTALSWGHQQDFSQSRRFTADVNYVTNTRLQRENTFNPHQSLATISSRATYAQRLGPASLDLGGNRTQYPGRPQVSQTLPTLTLTVPTLALARWLEWTPNIRFDNQQTLNLDQVGTTSYRYITREGGAIDSVLVRGDQRQTTASFSTPLKIFGWTWTNSFNFNERADNYPTPVTMVDPTDPTQRLTRVFDRTYQTGIDWQTGISLPSFFSGSWNLTPGVSFRNVDPGPFWVRSQFTGGRYVTQSKRLDYSMSMSPTFFGLFPGAGPVERIRHSVTPRFTWSYSPRATLNPEYLRATNQTRGDYVGTLAQNQMTLNLSQVFEARLASPDTTTAPDGGRKLKLLSLNFSPLTYDFERARAGLSGIATPDFSYDVASDLLPGFSFRSRYSLFQGNPMSDTAVFRPFREDISASFTFNQQSTIFSALARVFGRAVPPSAPQLERLEAAPDDALAQRIVGTPVAGSQRRDRELAIPTAGAWQAAFTFNSTRQREPIGGTVIDYNPADLCRGFVDHPLLYNQCILEQQARPTAPEVFNPVIGAPFVRIPPRETLQWNMNFHITPKWATQWRTTYDFREGAFASHQVTLQREMHDWRSNFAFTKAPNGNFSFMFFISLIAQPDLKFDYNRHTYRPLTPR
jgi:hypothetical protein